MDKLKDLMEVLEAKLIAKQKDEVKLDAQFLKNGRGHHAPCS